MKLRYWRWRWWLHADRPYVFTFTFTDRCHHVNRLGWQCFRPVTWDYWCGMHNSICYNLSDSSRHDRTHNRNVNRGTEAYRQSLEYISMNNPGWTPHECKRMAYTYLLLTKT